MKNQFNIILLILLLNLIFSNSANAQYESIFGEESTRMQLLTIDNMPVYVNTKDAFTSNSTVQIDDKTYHEFTWHTKQITGDWETLVPYYYLREDLNTGRVWLLPVDYDQNDDLEEILVVDMSLEVGDDFLYYPDPIANPEATSIETVIDVYYENDKKYIVFDREYDPSISEGLEDWNETQFLTFIEGVGSNFGYSHTYTQALLSCIYKDGVIDYQNSYQPLADLCDLETLSSTNEEFTNTSLYPNPANNTFQVNYPLEIGVSELKIYNLQGKLILQKPTYHQENIDVTDFSSGIYFVELTSRKGEVWRKKLIKE